MKKSIAVVVIVSVVAILSVVGTVSADPLIPGGTETWHQWDLTQLGSSGDPFWNRASRDTGGCNVGYWMVGSTTCLQGGNRFYTSSPGLTAAPDYFGDGFSTFTFIGLPGQAVSVTMGDMVSGWEGIENQFGWFEVHGDGRGFLFGPGYGDFGTRTFTPNGEFGFFLRSPMGTFTTSSTVEDPESRSHFAIFALDKELGRYILGMEDNTILDFALHADFDYNDMMLTVEFQPVPEPASMLLLGTGLVGLAARIRRRRRQ